MIVLARARRSANRLLWSALGRTIRCCPTGSMRSSNGMTPQPPRKAQHTAFVPVSQAFAPIMLSSASVIEPKWRLRPINGCRMISLAERQRLHRLSGLPLA